MKRQKIFFINTFFTALLGFIIWRAVSDEKSFPVGYASYQIADTPITKRERYNNTKSNEPNNGPMLLPATVQKIKSYHKDNSLPWSPYMDALDEETILKDAPLKDVDDIACVENSVISIIDEKPTYSVGDEIRLRIQLYDLHGRRRREGGDRMQVRMFEPSLNASARGYILDHMNGTYTAVVKCLWSGQPSINVYLDILRPAIRLYYHFFNTYYYYEVIYATYTDMSVKPCQPFEEWLNTTGEICNVTEINGDMPFFCEAPTSKELLCNEVYKFRKREKSSITPTTDAEGQLIGRFNLNFATKPYERMKVLGLPSANFPLITVNVTGLEHDDITPKVQPPCFSYNRTKLWFLPSPVGHFMYNEWKINHCSAPSNEKIENCLKGKRLFLLGDSTVFHWARDLKERFNCNITVVKRGNPIYPCEGQCSSYFCEQNKLRFDLLQHAMPGNIYRNHSLSVVKRILQYRHMKNVVFLLHYYGHVVREHPRLFRDRIRRTRQGIEEFLKINQDCHFFIKGGHFYEPGETHRYANYVFRLILIEEFEGLHDKVTYLDDVDGTIAENQVNIHPARHIVFGMVNQMLSYFCK